MRRERAAPGSSRGQRQLLGRGGRRTPRVEGPPPRGQGWQCQAGREQQHFGSAGGRLAPQPAEEQERPLSALAGQRGKDSSPPLWSRRWSWCTLAGSRMASPAASSSFSSSSSSEECRSSIGLDFCSCCLDLANRSGLERTPGRGYNNNLASPPASPFQLLREQLACENLNADKLSRIMRQDSLEPVVRDPCYLLNQGICNRNIDQTLLSILLFFHSASGDSVVAIDNKIEQAMDLVKNHLMYAVREEVEILKEQIKELVEKNSQLERENSLLKNLASPEQLQKFQSRLPLEVVPQTPQKQSPGSAAPAQHRVGSAV
ncbi:TSC22 domain family protein 3 isoform X1 [Hemicordylus capensis]|uniref:TSC22 domain family protein 3 isoform X1 n=1 Tax=Hemicordylus capensis TaxID=884348 RepID=UPI0023025E9F|nr:TSC22 domain family protein 3 isoform X1 [Hemicordylus capensis]